MPEMYYKICIDSCHLIGNLCAFFSDGYFAITRKHFLSYEELLNVTIDFVSCFRRFVIDLPLNLWHEKEYFNSNTIFDELNICKDFKYDDSCSIDTYSGKLLYSIEIVIAELTPLKQNNFVAVFLHKLKKIKKRIEKIIPKSHRKSVLMAKNFYKKQNAA